MKSNDSNRHAKNALVNLLVFPGLGSLRSGRWKEGGGQIFLVLAGSALMLLWLYKVLSQYYGLMFGDEKTPSVAWIGILGGVIFALGWAWAGVTSISLFRESARPAAAPPKLPAVPSPVPPRLPPRPPINQLGAASLADETQITAALAALPAWQRREQVIARTYEFTDFPAAMKFVNAVAALAEQAQHHPDMDIRWNRVTLALTTHDTGGLTRKDFALAQHCDAQAQPPASA